MAILVTGGAGYIGSHTCVELLETGYDIVVLDNFINSHPESLYRVKEITDKDFPIIKGDLLDRERIEQVFQNYKITAVIHFAGLKAVDKSVQDPLTYYHNNVTGTIQLCSVMQQYRVKNLVFSSSATVYGKADQVPIPEDAPLQTTNPYGSSKLMNEMILKDLYQSDKEWSITLLRYFNPIGAHPSGEIGEDPNGIPNNLMPYITQVAAGKLNELNVYGNDYDTHDGTGVRDYIHVVDLANGHVKAVDKVLNHTGVETYNLGTGKGYSVLEMIQTFEQVNNVSIPYKVVDRRAGDVGACFANPTKAEKELNWKASRTIQNMCEDAWRWQSQNVSGFSL
ncbi:UDP-glucose 4-epimerase GalE [Aquibacillus koreensis]|uniref:UDP-glucose 4-epimerase n=1 Tax=Aquibacillus koreensis TaxID=279446 RepID=A0A9X4AIX2_9BACI|nr:UDP-glucose 4-epimerase GalE [Aquibacillus koreensis]MCT2535125.1 UDP-glucose 4-epimerase GalE [Aquibacillus koreensis]MDC3419768.1 UDP-glucose 4-epimerase GalE [Aquibacillus koreensis]